MTHEEHLKQMQKDAELKKRGGLAMGFDQDATTHHFPLHSDGGAIEVDVKNPADVVMRTAVRAHLRDIAREFAAGDFHAPVATHAETPPGVTEMVRRRAAIAYAVEDTANGGRVRIRTKDTQALEAVHAFLEYQIREHAAHDSMKIVK